MALFIPPGFFELAFVLDATVGSPPYVTTMGCVQVDPDTDPQFVANRGFFAFQDAFADLIADEATLVKCTAQWDVDGLKTSVDSEQAAVPMTGEFTFADVRAAVIIQKRTARGGRAGRGRMFMPLSAQLDHVSVDGVVDADLRESWREAFITFGDDLALAATSSTAPVTPVLLHNNSAIDPDPITMINVSTRTGEIRGRR